MSLARRRFRIIKEIAEGGFGHVYLAEQISSDGFSRIVAIKLLHAKWSSHDEVVKRTRDEARVLGRIRHQHIVKVEDLTSIEGKCAIVMEYLEGVDLKWMSSFLKEKNLEFPRAALFEIVLAVASALDAAFNSIPLQSEQPLRAIHRDIKPSNIFVTVAGGVKVLDFGTARANFAEREAKTQALAFGSQGYMAPERMLGEEDTPAADIFSLGITLYELLTLESFGRIPPRPNKFQKKIEEKVASVQLNGDPEWVQQVRDTLKLMLSYAPADRPTAAQLVEIMDILAQESGDMGLRRYCRTLVQEAKDALPPLDTGDPLTGTIVDEDEFSGPATTSLPDVLGAQSNGPAPSTMPPTNMARGPASRSSVVEAAPAAGSPPSPNAPAVTGTLPPPAPPDVRTLNPNTGDVSSMTRKRGTPPGSRTPGPPPSVAPSASGSSGARSLRSSADSVSGSTSLGMSRPMPPSPRTPAPLEELEPEPDLAREVPLAVEPRRGGMGRAVLVLALGLVVVTLGVGAVLFVLSGLGVVVFWNTQPTIEQPVPAPEPPPPPPPEPVVGGKILTPDTRADKKTVQTVLTYSDPAGASVSLLGPGGFSASWDGKAPFDLGAAGAGDYKANIELPGGGKLRFKQFTIDPTKAKCDFTFVVDPVKKAGDWTGGCK